MVRPNSMMRTLVAIVLCGLCMLLGCQRDYERAGYTKGEKQASYPWENLEPGDPRLPADSRRNDGAGTEEAGNVMIPEGARWPALSTRDTISEEKLAGVWLRLAVMQGERIRLLDPEQIDHLNLRPDGGFAITYPASVPPRQPVEGDWRKAGPGQLEMTVKNAEPLTLNAELFRDDFLFFWDEQQKLSYWYARVPEQRSERIGRDRWKTSLGDMRIGNVIQSRFDFEVSGPSLRSGSGYYQDGILRLRWEDTQSSAGGYGAFIVSPDWKMLKGSWWIDDYEASPFGGAWDSLDEIPEA